jgi:lysozyme family protein
MILSVKAGTQLAEFPIAMEISFQNEGGCANDPNDPGGETNFGISSRAYPDEDIKGLTKERATFLYKRDRWYGLRLDSLQSQLVANNLFDFAIHHGVRGTTKKWQLVLARDFGYKGVVDGIVGAETIGFTNLIISRGEEVELNAKLVRARALYYASSAKPMYLKNFVTRAIRYL